MKEYIISIIALAFICAVVSMLSPEGEGGGLGKHVKLISGLLLILACLSPIISLVKGLYDLDLAGLRYHYGKSSEEYESIFLSELSIADVENVKQDVENRLAEKFGLKKESFSVSIRITPERDRIDLILIRLFDSAIWTDTGKLEEYLERIYNCEVVTAIG